MGESRVNEQRTTHHREIKMPPFSIYPKYDIEKIPVYLSFG